VPRQSKANMNNEPSISVVIVTWNAKDHAINCLRSIARQASESVETIVVDNCSSDGTADAIRSEFPQVQIIRNERNEGFARGNNAGLNAARGEYVCLINSDVVVPDGCFGRLMLHMRENPSIGIMGPKMLTPDGSVGRSVKRFPTVWNSFCCALGVHVLFKKSKVLGGFEMRGFDYDKTSDVDIVTGWFWMVRMAALKMVGGLDERFFIYAEDMDWCRRFKQSGWRVVYFADAEALHYGGGSSVRASRRFYIEMRRADLQYFAKHHGRRGEIGYRLVLWIHETRRLLWHGLAYCCGQSGRSRAGSGILNSVACLAWLAGRATVDE